jgi:hypothetical protein
MAVWVAVFSMEVGVFEKEVAVGMWRRGAELPGVVLESCDSENSTSSYKRCSD